MISHHRQLRLSLFHCFVIQIGFMALTLDMLHESHDS